MKKLVHYILIAIMFNWNIAVFAEEENKGCKWEVVEETDTYIQESCVGGEDGSFQARIRSKPVDGSIVIVEAPKKNKKKANLGISNLLHSYIYIFITRSTAYLYEKSSKRKN